MNHSNVDVFDSKSKQNVTAHKKKSSDISLILKYSNVNMCFITYINSCALSWHLIEILQEESSLPVFLDL